MSDWCLVGLFILYQKVDVSIGESLGTRERGAEVRRYHRYKMRKSQGTGVEMWRCAGGAAPVAMG